MSVRKRGIRVLRKSISDGSAGPTGVRRYWNLFFSLFVYFEHGGSCAKFSFERECSSGADGLSGRLGKKVGKNGGS